MVLKVGVFLLGVAALLFLLIVLADGHGVVILGICGPSPFGLIFLLVFLLTAAAGLVLTTGGLLGLLVRTFQIRRNHPLEHFLSK
jgi:hypothetical protein